MERKLSLLMLLGGLTWSCVTPAEVDEAEANTEEETGTGGSGGSGPVTSSTSGGSTGGGSTTGEQSTGGSTSGGSTSGEQSTSSTTGAQSTGGSTSGEQSTGGAGGQGTDDICPFDGELEYDPAAAYPYCSGKESFSFGEPLPGEGEPVHNRCREQTPGSSNGLGIFQWQSVVGSADDEPLNYCLCIDSCESDADCPAGDTGNAQPLCITPNALSSCHLACDNGETCPDGMTCTQGHEIAHRVCAWGTRGAACDTSEWPNVTQP